MESREGLAMTLSLLLRRLNPKMIMAFLSS
jgi:hypothetical protein